MKAVAAAVVERINVAWANNCLYASVFFFSDLCEVSCDGSGDTAKTTFL